ncbi:MAG: histidine kinase [Leptolyngbya sp. SIO3F4]|nr:histidine kinase [Leptolyngbya sp. SIO3F4]
MIETVIGSIAGPIFEQLWKAGGKVAGQIGKAQKDVRNIENVLKASQEYQRKYEDRHGQVKIMPGLMKEPVPLDSIYTAVKFLDERSIRYFATPEDLEQLYREQGKRGFQTASERHDGISIAQDKQYLMVLGGPGIGKSTFLRKLGLKAFQGAEFTRMERKKREEGAFLRKLGLKAFQGAEFTRMERKEREEVLEKIKRPLIPVFVELKAFRSETVDLAAAIAEEFAICGFPDAEEFTRLSLKQGKLLLLLDGLDEVPTRNMNQVIEKIEAFSAQHDKNTFVASCRTAAYHSSFKQFSDVTIADFDDEQIEQFIQRWFSSKLDQDVNTANQYWKQLKKPENKAAKELAQTPLLLTFLCLIYEREQELPNQRSTLYGRALDILLRDWSAQKRLERNSVYKYLSPEVEKELLSEIAYNSFKEDRLFFLKSDITDRINNYLLDTANIPAELDGSAVLEAIEVQQGILVERATDTYSFSHLTLQEYLTASYINSEWGTQKLINAHLTDERWREVFLLVSGLAGRRSQELWLAMEQQTNTFISSPKLQGLLEWAISLSDSSLPSNEMLASRAWLLYSASGIASASANVNTRARASTFASANAFARASGIVSVRADSDITSALTFARDSVRDSVIGSARGGASASARTIDNIIAKTITSIKIRDRNYKALSKILKDLKEQIPPDEATFNEWRSFANKLIETFLTSFHLNKELITFSRSEAQALEKYLYATNLLIECKNAAVRVSRKEWKIIESRLLIPPDKLQRNKTLVRRLIPQIMQGSISTLLNRNFSSEDD